MTPPVCDLWHSPHCGERGANPSSQQHCTPMFYDKHCFKIKWLQTPTVCHRIKNKKHNATQKRIVKRNGPQWKCNGHQKHSEKRPGISIDGQKCLCFEIQRRNTFAHAKKTHWKLARGINNSDPLREWRRMCAKHSMRQISETENCSKIVKIQNLTIQRHWWRRKRVGLNANVPWNERMIQISNFQIFQNFKFCSNHHACKTCRGPPVKAQPNSVLAPPLKLYINQNCTFCLMARNCELISAFTKIRPYFTYLRQAPWIETSAGMQICRCIECFALFTFSSLAGHHPAPKHIRHLKIRTLRMHKPQNASVYIDTHAYNTHTYMYRHSHIDLRYKPTIVIHTIDIHMHATGHQS